MRDWNIIYATKDQAYRFSTRQKYQKSNWEGMDIISDIKLKRLGRYLKYYKITKLFFTKFTEPI